MRLRLTSGPLKGRLISVPKTGLRPTEEKVRSAFFDILFSLIRFEERSFMDVFSGSGAMSFESLSRGLSKAYAVENNRTAAEMIIQNAQELETSKIRVIRADAYKEDTYKDLDKVNVFYIDPPYAHREQIPQLLNTYEKLELFAEVCVVGVENDKEVTWEKPGWSKKERRYGNTVLTVFYNWE